MISEDLSKDDGMKSAPDQKLVVVSPNMCPCCVMALDDRPSVSVSVIEQLDNNGWNLRGTGKTQERCRYCSQIYDALISAIPIQCSSLSCPGCRKTNKLRYTIKAVEKQGADFTFQAEIICSTCKTTSTIKEILKNIFNIKKIKIGADGISIERK